MRLLHNIGRAGDTVTTAFGRVAQDMTGGAKLFDSGTSLAIVNEALEKQKASEALAKRIWMSFVCEGNESLHMEDLIDVLGSDKQLEAEECFVFLDKDGNGDVSLDEMVRMNTSSDLRTVSLTRWIDPDGARARTFDQGHLHEQA
jgi:hypothetical protein